MPRVVLTDRERKRDALAGVIAKYETIYDVGRQDMARVLGMSRDTYRLRRLDPDKFTLGELKTLSRRLRIPRDELFGAIL